jgi:hypothetical protein
MAETSQLVAAFILNAIWQIPAITLSPFYARNFAQSVVAVSRGVWIAALGACLLIPTAAVVLQHRETTSHASEIAPFAQPDPVAEPSAQPIPVSFHLLSRSFSPGIRLFHVARLAWFGYRTLECVSVGLPASVAACSCADRGELCAVVLSSLWWCLWSENPQRFHQTFQFVSSVLRSRGNVVGTRMRFGINRGACDAELFS